MVISVRTQAGSETAVDMFYTWSFDGGGSRNRPRACGITFFLYMSC